MPRLNAALPHSQTGRFFEAMSGSTTGNRYVGVRELARGVSNGGCSWDALQESKLGQCWESAFRGFQWKCQVVVTLRGSNACKTSLPVSFLAASLRTVKARRPMASPLFPWIRRRRTPCQDATIVRASDRHFPFSHVPPEPRPSLCNYQTRMFPFF
jgi:hypothetical protein